MKGLSLQPKQAKQKVCDERVVKKKKVASEKTKSPHTLASKSHPDETWNLAYDGSDRLFGI